jgi:nucleotide-binding universal stress UspA family protein
LHGGGRRFDPGILHLPCSVSKSGEMLVTFTRILATTDGSEASLRAVEVALEMVVRDHTEFVLLTVVSVPQHVGLRANMAQGTIETYVEQMAQESLGPAMDLLRQKGVGAEVKAVVGTPPETVLAEIESSAADLVVMGRRSRYEPKDLILGSVSYRVARHVKVPILLVP